MEKSSFAMAKFGLEHKEAMPKRDCGFYVKYIFLFTSLIQFLIILGLVLFMVYGNVQAGTDTHLRLLEEQVQSHYGRIVALSATNANLSRVLNATLKDKDKLQGTALKVQKELEKCNSSQNSNSGPRLQDLVYQQVLLARCYVLSSTINASCNSDKVELQSQLAKATSSKKTLEESNQQSRAELAKASQDRERCQQDLKSARAEGELSRMELEVQKRKCSSLQSDVNEKLSRVTELARHYQCKEAENELGQIRGRVENLFREQQQRDSEFIWKRSCDLSVRQCELNCSREMQGLERRIQAAERRERDGQEERTRLQGEKDKAAKELEEKRREAVAQAEMLRERLVACVAKVPHLEFPGSRAPLGSGRSFPGPGPLLEFLGNPATLATLGKKNLEDVQRMVQEVLKGPSA